MRTSVRCTAALLSAALVLVFLGSVGRADGPEFLESYLDPRNPQTVFAVYDSATPDGVYLLHSRDGGRTWNKVRGPTGSAVKKLGRQDVGDFFITLGPPSSPRLIITYGAGGLWRASPDLQWQRYTPASVAAADTSAQTKEETAAGDAAGKTERENVPREPDINWVFSVPGVGASADLCRNLAFRIGSIELVGLFMGPVDLSSQEQSIRYMRRARDAAIRFCPDIKKKVVVLKITLYAAGQKVLLTGELDLEKESVKYRNYVIAEIESQKARTTMEADIERRMKEEGLQIDWEVTRAPLGYELKGKFKNAVDLSDDTAAKRFINLAKDVAIVKNLGNATIYLFSPKGPQDKYYICAYTDAWGKLQYTNYAAQYTAQQKAQEDANRQRKMAIEKYIVPFKKRHNVDIWINDRDPVTKQLFANPYSLKGKVVGFIGKFESMASENSGYFWIGHEGGKFGSPLPPIALKKIPSSKFVSPGKKFAIAARVLGVTSISVPSFGQIPTVEMIFIAAEEPFPGNLE